MLSLHMSILKPQAGRTPSTPTSGATPWRITAPSSPASRWATSPSTTSNRFPPGSGWRKPKRRPGYCSASCWCWCMPMTKAGANWTMPRAGRHACAAACPVCRRRCAVLHHPALPYAQLAAFMADLRTSQEHGSQGRWSSAILLRQPVRRGQAGTVVGDRLRGRCVDDPGRAHERGNARHRVPLSEQALALLRSSARGRPGRPTTSSPARRLGAAAVRHDDDRIHPAAPNEKELGVWLMPAARLITQHGFRSTFSDWASETTPFPSDVREMALSHSIGNRVEAAYRRGDLFEKRRQMMQAWFWISATCRRPMLSR